MKHLLLQIGLIFVFLSCSAGRENNVNTTKVTQIGNTDKFIMTKSWSCKMLAYDYNKYTPELAKIQSIIENSNCGNSNDSQNNDCTLNKIYAEELKSHLGNISELWKARCNISMPEKDKESILDTPACVSACTPYKAGCYTCAPNKNSFAGKGTITCGSQYDAVAAVKQYCLSNDEDCDIQCRFTPTDNEQIKFSKVGLGGISVSESYSNTYSFTGAISVEGGVSSPVISGSASSSVSATFETTNGIDIVSDTSHLYLDVKNDPSDKKTWRREYGPNTSYTCSLSKAILKGVSSSAAIKFGLSGEWFGIGGSFNVGFSTGTANSNRSAGAYMRAGISASGKTKEDIKRECAQWTQNVIQTYALASALPQTKIVLEVNEKIKCHYSNGHSHSVTEVAFMFNDDDSGAFSYTAKRTFGLKKVLTYSIPSEMDKYKIIMKANDKYYPITSAQKHEILRSALNELAKLPSQEGPKDWAISYCD